MGIDVQWAIFWVNLVLAITTFLAVLVALYKEDWRKPKIKVDFGNLRKGPLQKELLNAWE